MKKEDFDKLNEFLNYFFNKIEGWSPNYRSYLYDLCKVSDYIMEHVSGKFSASIPDINLTFEETYGLARDAIEYINSDYLELFNDMLPKGIIDFSFEKEYHDSHTRWHRKDDIYLNEVNINRTFNYDEAMTIVHEFIHYTNNGKIPSYNYNFLSEFLAIYFELVAGKYFIQEKHIDKNEIPSKVRICNFFSINMLFNKYCLIFLSFDKFGNISEKTYEDMKEYLKVEDKTFVEECEKILKMVNESGYERAYDYFSYHYKYISGTILAYYALNNVKMEDMVDLNDNINEDKYAVLSIEEILEKLGIDLSLETVDKSLAIMHDIYFEQEKEKNK